MTKWDQELEKVLATKKHALVGDKSGKNMDKVFELEIKQLVLTQNNLVKMNKKLTEYYDLKEWSKKPKTGKFNYELTLTYQQKGHLGFNELESLQEECTKTVGGFFGSQSKVRFNGDFMVVTIVI